MRINFDGINRSFLSIIPKKYYHCNIKIAYSVDKIQLQDEIRAKSSRFADIQATKTGQLTHTTI